MRSSKILLAALAVAVFTAGCAPGLDKGVAPAASEITNLIQSSMPPLPIDKAGSATVSTKINGKDTYRQSNNAQVIGNALNLVSSDDALAWGMWQFNPEDTQIKNVEVTLSDITGEGVYVALSDYQKGAWAISGPYTVSLTVQVDNLKHRLGLGALYIAIIAHASGIANVLDLELEADNGWVIVTVDALGDVGRYTSLAVVDGNPAIAYYMVSGGLKYAYSSTPTGHDAADWNTIVVEGGSAVGAYCSLAVVDGSPAISFRDSTNNDLKYARSATASGANPGDWQSVIVDDGGGILNDMGVFTSLAVIEGNPAISYAHLTNTKHTLKYARANSVTGAQATDWQAIAIKDFTLFDILDTSLAEIDGNPAISFGIADNSGGDYGYAVFSRSTTGTGVSPADWTDQFYVDSGASGVSLAVINGKPAIANHIGGMDWDLGYAHASTSSGEQLADWSSIRVPKVTLYIGGSPSLAEIQDNDMVDPPSWPAISHTSWSEDEGLLFSASSTSTGENPVDWHTQMVEPGQFGSTSLASVDGKPAISYYDWSTGDLKYAIRIGP